MSIDDQILAYFRTYKQGRIVDCIKHLGCKERDVARVRRSNPEIRQHARKPMADKTRAIVEFLTANPQLDNYVVGERFQMAPARIWEIRDRFGMGQVKKAKLLTRAGKDAGHTNHTQKMEAIRAHVDTTDMRRLLPPTQGKPRPAVCEGKPCASIDPLPGAKHCAPCDAAMSENAKRDLSHTNYRSNNDWR